MVKTLVALIAIAAVAAFAYSIMFPQNTDYYGESGGDAAAGGFRACIKSVFAGESPECADYDGICKRTMLNGVIIGDCKGVDSNNRCIPC